MNFQRSKFVRFEDWSPERSCPTADESSSTARPYLDAVLNGVRRRLEKGSERIRSLRKPLGFHTRGDFPNKDVNSGKKIFDPQGSFIQNWNKIFLFVCVVALAFDPLFFYIPVVDRKKYCLDLDKKLETTACVLRTFIDVLYIVRIVFQFRTGFISRSSQVFGRGELIEDPKAIAKRYLCSYFLVDVLAILPIPQIAVLAIVPSVKQPVSFVTKEWLKAVIVTQYAPRIIRIYPLFKEVTRTSGILMETAWAGAAYNLFLYMLASHVFGALWYLISIERQDSCWRLACHKEEGCDLKSLYCGKSNEITSHFLNSSCPLVEDPEGKENSTVLDFGIFLDALKSGVVESRYFPKKFFYCFWWGLRNLSALGQNLETSDFIGEIIFAICMCIAGLVLFALLIGNMQTYLQSTTVRVEEMRVKRRDAEGWMSHRMLPEDLRERIRKYEQYKWQETRGVDEEAVLHGLPKDLRKDIKRHLCLSLLERVPWFQKMDDRLLDALCERLKPALYTKDSYIVREGDPVEEMLLIMRGNLKSTTTYGGRTGFFNLVILKAGDFVGDLLTWALDPHSSAHLPISSRTVQTLTEVEGFILSGDDLKFVASQYRRLHSKQLRHTYRFYSVQWQTWAACFIQSVWRRHCRRKLAKSLREEEAKRQSTLQDESTDGDSTVNIGTAIYASRFASNALRNVRQNGTGGHSRVFHSQPLPLLPRKPADPDFSCDDA